MAGVERDAHELELDSIAWNLPDPFPSELHKPPQDEWPTWPFQPVRSDDMEVELHRFPAHAE